jgi:hypothetical protein
LPPVTVPPAASSTNAATLSRVVALISGPTSTPAHARTDPQRSHRLRQPPGELVDDGIGDVEPVGGGAGLPGVAHLRLHRSRHRGVEIGVGEHQERGIAPQLHRDVEHPCRCGLEQGAAGLGGTGE